MVKKGYLFGQGGGNGQSGKVDKCSRFAGLYSRHLWSKGGIRLPPPAPRSRSAQERSRKKTKNGVRARHGLRASCQRFGIAFDDLGHRILKSDFSPSDFAKSDCMSRPILFSDRKIEIKSSESDPKRYRPSSRNRNGGSKMRLLFEKAKTRL